MIRVGSPKFIEMTMFPPMKRRGIIVSFVLVSAATIAVLLVFPFAPASPLFVRSLPVQSSKLISVRLNSDGDAVAAATSNGQIVRWDLANNVSHPIKDLSDFTISAFSWTPDGSIIAGDTGRQLLSWKLDRDDLQTSRNLPGVATAIAFRKSAAGAASLVTTTDGILLAYEPKGVRKLEVNTSATLKTLDVHASGNLALIGDSDGQLHIVDLVTLTVKSTQKAHDGEVSVAAFSPDSRRILSADWNGAVQVRRLGNKNSTAELMLASAVSCGCWAEDTVVLGTSDGQIHFWLPVDNEPYATISSNAAILGLDVQQEQNIVLTVSNTSKVDVWRIPEPN